MLKMTFALFGWPAMIAAKLMLLRKTRQDLMKWLAPMEALARRLLALEALRLPPRNDPPEFYPQGHIVSALRDAPPAELSENESEWRVRFVAWGGPAKRKAGEKLTVRGQGRSQFNALTLARRLEALRRLIENHDGEVRRLARKIAAHRVEAKCRFAPYRCPSPLTTPLEEVQADLDAAFAANTS
ncbi:MAG: hypothetical protein WDN76_09335 [Alphaproteobacteria bacterium]